MDFRKRISAILLVVMMLVSAASFALADIDDSTWIDNPDFPGQIGLAKYPEPQHYTISKDTGLGPVHKPGLTHDENMWKTEYENLNIFLDIAWTAEGYEAYSQKLTLNIGSQDIPEVFLCNAAQFQLLCENDLIQPLDEVMEKYASDFFKENMQSPDAQEALKQATYQGKLYGIPMGSAGSNFQHMIFIREDWRLALGLAEPTTMEALTELARAFTEDDPDGNGANDTYGYCLGNSPITTYMSINGLANSFGAFPGIWIEKDGTVQYGSVQPEMKNALAFLADWYEKGYIDREFIVKDNYAASMDMVAGKGGIAGAEWWLATWPLPDAYQNGHQWKAYPLPFDASAPEQMVATRNKQDTKLVVRKDVADPSVAIKLSNIYQERILGPESDLYVWKGDGEYDFTQYTYGGSLMGPDKNLAIMYAVTEAIDTDNPDMLTSAEEKQVYGYIKGHLDNSPSREESPQAWATNYLFHHINYGIEQSCYGIMNTYTLNGMNKVDIFKGAFGEAMTERMGQLESLTNETFTNIISGGQPIDDFDAYVAQFNAQGGVEVAAEVTAWYEAMK